MGKKKLFIVCFIRKGQKAKVCHFVAARTKIGAYNKFKKTHNKSRVKSIALATYFKPYKE